MSSEAGVLLKSHGIRVTIARTDVIEAFQKVEHALTHSDIQTEVEEDHDRVTIYRTLKLFEEKGLIHKVLGDDHLERYALCKHQHNESEKHDDQHVHFKCNDCGNTFCLEETAIPYIHVPSGFTKSSQSVLVKGFCKDCV